MDIPCAHPCFWNQIALHVAVSHPFSKNLIQVLLEHGCANLHVNAVSEDDKNNTCENLNVWTLAAANENSENFTALFHYYTSEEERQQPQQKLHSCLNNKILSRNLTRVYREYGEWNEICFRVMKTACAHHSSAVFLRARNFLLENYGICTKNMIRECMREMIPFWKQREQRGDDKKLSSFSFFETLLTLYKKELDKEAGKRTLKLKTVTNLLCLKSLFLELLVLASNHKQQAAILALVHFMKLNLNQEHWQHYLGVEILLAFAESPEYNQHFLESIYPATLLARKIEEETMVDFSTEEEEEGIHDDWAAPNEDGRVPNEEEEGNENRQGEAQADGREEQATEQQESISHQDNDGEDWNDDDDVDDGYNGHCRDDDDNNGDDNMTFLLTKSPRSLSFQHKRQLYDRRSFLKEACLRGNFSLAYELLRKWPESEFQSGYHDGFLLRVSVESFSGAMATSYFDFLHLILERNNHAEVQIFHTCYTWKLFAENFFLSVVCYQSPLSIERVKEICRVYERFAIHLSANEPFYEIFCKKKKTWRCEWQSPCNQQYTFSVSQTHPLGIECNRWASLIQEDAKYRRLLDSLCPLFSKSVIPQLVQGQHWDALRHLCKTFPCLTVYGVSIVEKIYKTFFSAEASCTQHGSLKWSTASRMSFFLFLYDLCQSNLHNLPFSHIEAMFPSYGRFLFQAVCGWCNGSTPQTESEFGNHSHVVVAVAPARAIVDWYRFDLSCAKPADCSNRDLGQTGLTSIQSFFRRLIHVTMSSRTWNTTNGDGNPAVVWNTTQSSYRRRHTQTYKLWSLFHYYAPVYWSLDFCLRMLQEAHNSYMEECFLRAGSAAAPAAITCAHFLTDILSHSFFLLKIIVEEHCRAAKDFDNARIILQKQAKKTAQEILQVSFSFLETKYDLNNPNTLYLDMMAFASKIRNQANLSITRSWQQAMQRLAQVCFFIPGFEVSWNQEDGIRRALCEICNANIETFVSATAKLKPSAHTSAFLLRHVVSEWRNFLADYLCLPNRILFESLECCVVLPFAQLESVPSIKDEHTTFVCQTLRVHVWQGALGKDNVFEEKILDCFSTYLAFISNPLEEKVEAQQQQQQHQQQQHQQQQQQQLPQLPHSERLAVSLPPPNQEEIEALHPLLNMVESTRLANVNIPFPLCSRDTREEYCVFCCFCLILEMADSSVLDSQTCYPNSVISIPPMEIAAKIKTNLVCYTKKILYPIFRKILVRKKCFSEFISVITEIQARFEARRQKCRKHEPRGVSPILLEKFKEIMFSSVKKILVEAEEQNPGFCMVLACKDLDALDNHLRLPFWFTSGVDGLFLNNPAGFLEMKLKDLANARDSCHSPQFKEAWTVYFSLVGQLFPMHAKLDLAKFALCQFVSRKICAFLVSQRLLELKLDQATGEYAELNDFLFFSYEFDKTVVLHQIVQLLFKCLKQDQTKTTHGEMLTESNRRDLLCCMHHLSGYSPSFLDVNLGLSMGCCNVISESSSLMLCSQLLFPRLALLPFSNTIERLFSGQFFRPLNDLLETPPVLAPQANPFGTTQAHQLHVDAVETTSGFLHHCAFSAQQQGPGPGQEQQRQSQRNKSTSLKKTILPSLFCFVRVRFTRRRLDVVWECVLQIHQYLFLRKLLQQPARCLDDAQVREFRKQYRLSKITMQILLCGLIRARILVLETSSSSDGQSPKPSFEQSKQPSPESNRSGISNTNSPSFLSSSQDKDKEGPVKAAAGSSSFPSTHKVLYVLSVLNPSILSPSSFNGDNGLHSSSSSVPSSPRIILVDAISYYLVDLIQSCASTLERGIESTKRARSSLNTVHLAQATSTHSLDPEALAHACKAHIVSHLKQQHGEQQLPVSLEDLRQHVFSRCAMMDDHETHSRVFSTSLAHLHEREFVKIVHKDEEKNVSGQDTSQNVDQDNLCKVNNHNSAGQTSNKNDIRRLIDDRHAAFVYYLP